MAKNLRWKLLTIALVVVAAAFAVYPPEDQIRLGLDLRGGVHMVLQVHTDDALMVESETSAEQLNEQAGLNGITLASSAAVSPTEIRVEGVPADRDQEFRTIAEEVLGVLYTRESQPNGAYTFRMQSGVERARRDESVRQALQTIARRVDELGVAEPVVTPYGGAGGEQILVQLPGVEDVAGAKEIIRSTGLLELKLVEEGPAPTREFLLQTRNGVVPADMEVISGLDETLGGVGGAALSAQIEVSIGIRLEASGGQLQPARDGDGETLQEKLHLAELPVQALDVLRERADKLCEVAPVLLHTPLGLQHRQEARRGQRRGEQHDDQEARHHRYRMAL